VSCAAVDIPEYEAAVLRGLSIKHEWYSEQNDYLQ
jgi:hypothetical protein